MNEIDTYIARFPKSTQEILGHIRALVRRKAPSATEKISYGVPSFQLNGYLVYYAGFAHHVSVYPAPRGVKKFETLLSGYKGGKGTVQFPLDRPIPYDLIEKIVAYRIEQNLKK